VADPNVGASPCCKKTRSAYCFRFRNRIGIDVAREALSDSLAQRKATRNQIWRFARLCRMAQVMRPYPEMTP
jgi:hypothetical protein